VDEEERSTTEKHPSGKVRQTRLCRGVLDGGEKRFKETKKDEETS
jgi:hypothetical protein